MPNRNLERYYAENSNIINEAILNYTQEDMFEPYDENNWAIVDVQPFESGTYNITFSTPSAIRSNENVFYDFQNMQIDPIIAEKLINNKSDFQVKMLDSGEIKIAEEEKPKKFKSKNGNKMTVLV